MCALLSAACVGDHRQDLATAPTFTHDKDVAIAEDRGNGLPDIRRIPADCALSDEVEARNVSVEWTVGLVIARPEGLAVIGILSAGIVLFLTVVNCRWG